MIIKRLSSAISTAHAISLAIREAPDAIRECVEFARENGSTTEEVEFWKAARDRWMDWACHIEGGQKTPGVADSWDGDSNMMARITAAIEAGSSAMAQITEARELLSGLSSGLGYGIGGESESLASMISRVEGGIRDKLRVITELRDTAQRERACLQSDVASLKAALGAECNVAIGFSQQVDALKSKLTETEHALAEMNQLYDEQCKATIVARENVEGLYSEAVKERDELKTRVENQASEIAALRNRVTRLTEERDLSQREQDAWRALVKKDSRELENAEMSARVNRDINSVLRKDIARHEAAERWRDVEGDGVGEFPPPTVEVLFRGLPMDKIHYGRPHYQRFQWRYLSSKDVP